MSCTSWLVGSCKNYVKNEIKSISGNSGRDGLLTREADLKHDSLLPVFDRADGGELEVEQAEEGARQQSHQAHEHAIVAGVCVLVEDTVKTLTANVNIALIHDRGKDHQGKYLQTGERQRRWNKR